jgi:dTDP-4-dehydrorhamnose reductase
MNSRRNGNGPRLLVIGARGFLGTFVTRRASSLYEVIRGDRSRHDDQTDAIINVADSESVKKAFAESSPDAVILLAAISDIDRCQREKDLAVSVNLYGAENVANACARSGARLLFTSTGAVFDGLKHGYSEEDEVSPVSIYGETKAQAEGIVQSLAPKSLILRVSLVIGRTRKTGTNSLLDTMIRRWGNGEVISAPVHESRNPIDAPTLSQWMIELLSNDASQGIFHTGATDSMTRYELAKAIAARLDVPQDLIQPEFTSKPGRAPRGPDHYLLTGKISGVCATQPPSCQEVIERSLNEVAEGSIRAGV